MEAKEAPQKQNWNRRDYWMGLVEKMEHEIDFSTKWVSGSIIGIPEEVVGVIHTAKYLYEDEIEKYKKYAEECRF